MKQIGILFDNGLCDEELKLIESIYEFKFPRSLKNMYSIALPVSNDMYEFPMWNDFSDANIDSIKKHMNMPYRQLSLEVDKGFYIPNNITKSNDWLDTAPVLIPIYSHRYMPAIDHIDPPIISTIGRDAIFYGDNLCHYLQREFLNKNIHIEKAPLYVPLWSDIINYYISF